MSKLQKTLLTFALALTLSGVSAVVITRKEREVNARYGVRVDVLTALTDIKAGEKITAKQLGITSLPQRFVSVDALNAPAQVVGKKSTVDISSGSYILKTYTESSATNSFLGVELAEGDRIVDVVVSGSLELVKPGVHVDVLVTKVDDRDPNSRGNETKVALEEVAVVAVKPVAEFASDAEATGQQKIQVSLKVDTADAVYLSAAENFAKEIRLLVRPEGEGPSIKYQVDAQDL